MSKIISIFVVTIVLLAGSSPELFGQNYPDHLISLIIPMAPGDAVKIAGRIMAEA